LLLHDLPSLIPTVTNCVTPLSETIFEVLSDHFLTVIYAHDDVVNCALIWRQPVTLLALTICKIAAIAHQHGLTLVTQQFTGVQTHYRIEARRLGSVAAW
jgi:hypothetical protein